MSIFWTHLRKYLAFRQLALIGGLLIAMSSFAQTTKPHLITRKPASYVPDDDVIVKPVHNEMSFYQQYVNSDKSQDVINSRNQLQVWQANQEFADNYGMDSSLTGSPYFVPTPEEKWEYFKDRYLRYLRRRGEQPFKDMPKNWYQEYRASNEIDTIDEMEGRFKSSNKSASGRKKKEILPDSFQEKEVSVWKKTKFIFQPRLDQGLVIIGFRNATSHARAWVGINGETEVNVRHDIQSIGMRMMWNYYVHSGEYFSSVDQHLVDNVYARYTSSKNPDTEIKDDTIMLLYTKQF